MWYDYFISILTTIVLFITSFFQNEEPVIEFYKARVGYFYSGLLDQVDFGALDLKIGRQINQMIGDKTGNVISDFMQNDEIPSYMPPMISFGANIFQVFCKN